MTNFRNVLVGMMFFFAAVVISTPAASAGAAEIQSGSETGTLQGPVKGTITDGATGEPLIGVTVVIKGTTMGQITDARGQFSINLPGQEATLVFSFIGYTTQESVVSAGSTVNIRMQLELQQMEEVVVVGYGIQKKESVVGSITQATGDQILNSLRGADLTNALTGNLPGLITVQNNGIPGGSGAENPATRIFIRGRKTWNNSQPLILVDGIERDMNEVDPYTVEGISVLKDASATSVFGVKGANGVILITTKRGTLGRPRLTVNATSTAKMVSRVPETLGSYDANLLRNYVLLNEVVISEGAYDRMIPDEYLEYYKNQTYPEYFPDVNWREAMLKDVTFDRNINMSISGGTKAVKYFGSLSYLNEGDILKIQDYGQGYDPSFQYDRFNYRSNLDFTITPTTNFSVNLAGFFSNQKRPRQGLINQDWYSLYGYPHDLIPVTYSDGTWANYEDDRFKNYLLGANFTGYSKTNSTQVNTDFMLKQNLDFITKGLSFKAKLSYDITAATTGQNLVDDGIITKYISKDIVNEITPGMTEEEIKALEVKYTKWLEPDNSNSAAGLDFMSRPFTYSNETADGNANSFFRSLNYELSLDYNRDFGKHNVGGLFLMSRNERARGSVFPSYREDWVGRLVYNYDKRYILEVNGAYNGSEKFSKDYRFGFFPSLAAGWIVSNEQFFTPVKPFVNELKFRFSNGKVGSDAGIDRWQYIGSYEVTNSRAWFGSPTPSQSTYPQRAEGIIPNADLHWETSEKSDLGIEAGFFDNMLQVNFDYFWEHRSDIFVGGNERIVPVYFGAPPVSGNIGEVKTEGWEVETDFSNTTAGGLRYTAGISVAFAKDLIIKKSDPELAPDYQKQAGYAIDQPRITLPDRVMNSWNDVYTGVVGQTNANLLPGDFRSIDFDSDGVITIKDDAPYGYSNRPQYTYSPKFGLDYKGFSLNLMFYGAFNMEGMLTYGSFVNEYSIAYDYTRDASWNPQLGIGEDAKYSAIRITLPSRQFYIDRSYLRLKTAVLSYNVNSSLIKKVGLSGMRLHVNGENLLYFSKAPMDNESNDDYRYRSYPVLKRVTLGLSVNF
jgi:TonB-linked SusC/RagA family outer membrane protein